MNQYLPFRYFKASPEIIRLAVMYYVRFPLSLRQVEDIREITGNYQVNDPSAAETDGVNSHIKAAEFIKTVIQKTARKDYFAD